MDIFPSLIVGVASGLTASIAFFYLLRNLRPNISISPYIARTEYNGKKYFDFKIVNYSSRSAINICVHAVLATPINVEGGPLYQTIGINLVHDTSFELSRFDESDLNANYALRFSTPDDLDAMWADETSLIRFRLIATDSESGFSRAYIKEFHTKRNSVKDGLHEFGNSLDVS